MISLPWLRVPGDLLDRDEKEQLAWIFVLGRWHQGKPATEPSVRELTGWGGSKVGRFLKEVAEWAQANGAATPTPSRGKSGVKPGWKRGESGVSDKPQSATISEKQGETGVETGWKRGESGVSAPENQPPTPPPAPLKTEIEIKNCLTPPTPSPGSGSPPAQEGGQASESLIFLGSADREALAKHGIKTVSGLKAAHKRQPLRYLKGVGEARANRIFGLLAEKFPSDPELSALSQAAPTSPANAEAGFDEIANNFWKSKETPNAIANA